MGPFSIEFFFHMKKKDQSRITVWMALTSLFALHWRDGCANNEILKWSRFLDGRVSEVLAVKREVQRSQEYQRR